MSRSLYKNTTTLGVDVVKWKAIMVKLNLWYKIMVKLNSVIPSSMVPYVPMTCICVLKKCNSMYIALN